MSLRYVVVDDTVWPVDDDPDASLQWRLRYAGSSITDRDRQAAASILSAYAALTNPRQSMKDAIASLRRAREAARTPREDTRG